MEQAEHFVTCTNKQTNNIGSSYSNIIIYSNIVSSTGKKSTYKQFNIDQIITYITHEE